LLGGGFTDLVGRQGELAAVAAALTESRLVTIVGPGGVGKTRVALVTAAQTADGYPDGPWIAELSGLRDPLLLPNTVASVLGVPDQDARSALDTVLDYLKERRLLLILDTCEHVLDACATLVRAIQQDAPGVTVLATSRQALDMPGEHTFPIGPLPVPSQVSVSSLSAGDAVELFALRAAGAVPGFAVTTGNASDVVRLCRRLDGIPLALELAAGRLRGLPLSELVQRLDHRFEVLTGGQPGSLERHQTLQMAISWSYELCSAAEQRLWARLSVFAGTFSLAEAEEVCAEVDLERSDVISGLIGLVDKSVVLREGERYRMLDTLREFGAERLAESGELAACRMRHIGRYREMARYFGEHFADDDQMARYHALREVHANLRAALEYALDDASGVSGVSESAAVERWRAGADLACSLYGYWQISCLLGEGGYWLTKALDRFPSACPERARALVNRGFLRSFAGGASTAVEDCEAGISLALALGDEPVIARGYHHVMLAYTFNGQHSEAEKVVEEARVRLRACGDVAGELMLMATLGHLYQLSGRPAEGVAACEEGLALDGLGGGEQWVSTYCHFVMGVALFQMPGREADCEAMALRALAGKSELGDVIGMAYALDLLGWLSAQTGRPERAAWLLGAAGPLWERGGGVRFSGTKIMEGFHQSAAAAASLALGASRYSALFASGMSYVRGELDARAGGAGGALRLEIP
jgi:non-specific serine/threonine protein kinase